MADNKQKLNRRQFLKQSTMATAAITTGLPVKHVYAARKKRSGKTAKKVIVIGFDGMDPRLSEKMMNDGLLPNLARLRKQQGYQILGTSIPPQSPVAWANFINGAGPGTHGIFDFIHRNPQRQVAPFLSTSETVSGEGYWQTGDHKLQLDFWPFSHKPAETVLRRQGTPFWDYLDQADIQSTFYDLPSNYPPSRSKHGNHRCLAGMGAPDLQGNYGGYHHFAEDGPFQMEDDGGCKRSMLFFENEQAGGTLFGPPNTFLKNPQSTTIDFVVHRDIQARAAIVEIQGRKVLLKEGQWSRWLKLEFELTMPSFLPDKNLSGICRFYLQEVAPNFRLYVSPINTDPSEPALRITEPPEFIEKISDKLGLFYTTGFQEDHKALSTKIFVEDEFITQAGIVLEERLNLLEYALENYDDGLLFFYFSSTDLQGHMLWWDSDDKHPVRSPAEAKRCFNHLQNIYRKMDDVIGRIVKRYGDQATIMVMSDHGFANFKRQFNLNTWLRNNGYLAPADASRIVTLSRDELADVDWSRTRAYGLGINGLYLNLSGREMDGIVQPGREREELIAELISKLQAVTDLNGNRVIRKVHRTDKAYSGPATKLAPDLIVGYCRGYRASWATCLGGMPQGEDVLLDNDSAWSADHCADVSEVPGVVFSNRPIAADKPLLVDMAPSILTEFGLKIPSTMTGKNIFTTQA